ncbi:MAG: restriction endonuclease subunit S, partial [Clostridia bacterium]|nr:restriction endonuclease subunit S [Clostridia bacterium]
MKLKEYVLSANTGLDAIKRAPIVDYDTGLKCIRIQDISQNKSFEDWGDTLTTSSDYTKFRLCTNDILVARTGATVGVSYIVLKDYNAVFNNGTIRLKLKGNCNPKFIYYVLQTREFMQYIDNVSCVATQPNLRVENLLRFYIPDLSIEKQNSIVNFLSTYDELIENNNKRIKILEQMAENLYKEWFVRFRFPGHETTEFENGLPKGWQTKRLGEFGVFLDSGSRPKGGIDDTLTEGVPSLGAEAVGELAQFDYSSVKYIPHEFYDKMKRGKFDGNAILVYKDGAYIGKTTIFRNKFPFECFAA